MAGTLLGFKVGEKVRDQQPLPVCCMHPSVPPYALASDCLLHPFSLQESDFTHFGKLRTRIKKTRGQLLSALSLRICCLRTPLIDDCDFLIVALKFKCPPGMCYKCVSL